MTAVLSPTSSAFRTSTSSPHAGHSFRDRTQELRSIFDLLKQSSASSVSAPGTAAAEAAAAATAASSSSQPSSSSKQKAVQQQSEELRRFNDAASRFSVDLSNLAGTVANLTRLTQHGSGASSSGADAFEENSQEIGRLTQVVRTRLGQLHDDLNALGDLKEASDTSMHHSAAIAKHNNAVVSALRSKLVSTGNGFKQTLQKRTQTMKDASNRRSKLLADRSGGHAFDGDTSRMFGAAFQQRSGNNNDASASSSSSAAADTDGSAASGASQSTALVQQQRNLNYLRDRQQAVHEIELAVREVGEIVQDFTQLVYEQDETIIRIDNDVDDAQKNVDAGSAELMKYLASLTSQRGFILRVMAVLFCFLLFFGFFIVR